MQSSNILRHLSAFLPLALPALVLLASVAPAAGQGTPSPIIIRQPPQTIIASLPYTITKPGLYVLNSDLSSGLSSGSLITVDADDVTIDLQGHCLSGPPNNSGTLDGISTQEHRNLTIRNGAITSCLYGVYTYGNRTATTNNLNQAVDNLRVTHCSLAGIGLFFAPASAITNCKVSELSGAYGILVGGTGVTVRGCDVSQVEGGGTGVGIHLDHGSFARQNSVSTCYYGIIDGICQDNLAADCTIPFYNDTDGGGNVHN